MISIHSYLPSLLQCPHFSLFQVKHVHIYSETCSQDNWLKIQIVALSLSAADFPVSQTCLQKQCFLAIQKEVKLMDMHEFTCSDISNVPTLFTTTKGIKTVQQVMHHYVNIGVVRITVYITEIC